MGDALDEGVVGEDGDVEDDEPVALALELVEHQPPYVERLLGTDGACEADVGGHVDPRAELPGDAYFAITLPNPERGGIRVTVPVPPERAVEVSSPHSGEVRAELVAPTATSRPRVGGRILESDELLELVIDLEAVGQRFRIVDPAGQPVPRVAIRMILRDGPPPGWDGFADEVGELTMEPFVPGSYLAYMEHPELGYHFGVPVEVPQLTPEPVDIRFLPNQVVELRLLDGAEPLPSVTSWVPLCAQRFMSTRTLPSVCRTMMSGLAATSTVMKSPAFGTCLSCPA